MGSAGIPPRRSTMGRRRTSDRRSSMRANIMTTNNNNWRNELSYDSRQKIINKIMDTLHRHMPFTGPDGMHELKKIALRFEEKNYRIAVDQQDYLRKISLKMLSLRNHVFRDGNSLAGGSSSSNQKPVDPGEHMRSAMDSASTMTTNNNWRNELSQDYRQKIINKMVEILQKHMPFTGPDGKNELTKISLRCEEKIFAAAVDQKDYLRKIFLKMLAARKHVSQGGNLAAGVTRLDINR